MIGILPGVLHIGLGCLWYFDKAPPADVARHDRLVALVEGMLALHKQLAAAKMPTAKTMLQRQIDASDRQIDRLVYELYDLTEEEIGIVEEHDA